MVSPADAIKINCRKLGYELDENKINFSVTPIKISAVALSILGGVGVGYIGLAGGYALALSTAAADNYLKKNRSAEHPPICIVVGAVAAIAQNALLGYGVGLLAFIVIRSLANSAIQYVNLKNHELNAAKQSLFFPPFQNYLVDINTHPNSQNYLHLYQQYLETERAGNGPILNKVRTITNDAKVLLYTHCETRFEQEGHHTHNFIQLAIAVVAIAAIILTGSPIGFGIVLLTDPLRNSYDQKRNQKFKLIFETFPDMRFQNYIDEYVRTNNVSLIYLKENISRIYDDYIRTISQQRPVEGFANPRSAERNGPPPLNLPPGDDNPPSWSGAE